ncbi:hypothetical protein YB2330_004390 [Saitoella coloradoensis]
MLQTKSRTMLTRTARRITARIAVKVGALRHHSAAAATAEAFTPPPIEHPVQSFEHTRARKPLIKDALPFSAFLTDNHSRQHTYLRISITQKCNLRCTYCMPEEGIELSPPEHLLTTDEILKIAEVFVGQGVTKIRLTGGEPTVRKDIVQLVERLGRLKEKGLKELAMTSNGIALARKLPALVKGGLTHLNLSLDTLDPFKYQMMARRKGLEAVLKCIDTALALGVQPLKINSVVIRNVNDAEILDFVAMTKDKPVEVRFIEYMPFDGNRWNKEKMLSYQEMLERIQAEYPTFEKVKDHENDTSKTYRVPGFAGRIGFITSMTNHFCGTCNRLRITSDGNLKVCLFGNAEVSLRDLLRQPDITDDKLLETIGMAVKRKHKQHAGIGNLEHMKNRPMILIGDVTRKTKLQFERRLRGSFSAFSAYIPVRLQYSPFIPALSCARAYSTGQPSPPAGEKLTHVNEAGHAHMVNVGDKQETKRIATARATITFTTSQTLALITSNSLKKGDVLATARIAGIMATKRTADLIPLCHNIPISKVSVTLIPVVDSTDQIEVECTVECRGQTGVEMEALMGCSNAALTVYDMCKAVDRGMRVDGLRVVEKRGGKSGDWREGRDGQLVHDHEV